MMVVRAQGPGWLEEESGLRGGHLLPLGRLHQLHLRSEQWEASSLEAMVGEWSQVWEFYVVVLWLGSLPRDNPPWRVQLVLEN